MQWVRPLSVDVDWDLPYLSVYVRVCATSGVKGHRIAESAIITLKWGVGCIVVEPGTRPYKFSRAWGRG